MANKNGEGCRVIVVIVKYKYDEKLFRRYTRNASERRASLLMAVLSWRQQDLVLRELSNRLPANQQRVWPESESPKDQPNMMVTGRMVEEGDQECVALNGGGVEAENEFPYLGEDSGMDADLNRSVDHA